MNPGAQVARSVHWIRIGCIDNTVGRGLLTATGTGTVDTPSESRLVWTTSVNADHASGSTRSSRY